MLKAEDLRAINKASAADTAPPLDIAEGWLFWFEKRGERMLKDCAKLGYTELAVDLPIEIATSFDRPALVLIQKTLRGLLDGCFVGFVEDEYKGKPICRVFVQWQPESLNDKQ